MSFLIKTAFITIITLFFCGTCLAQRVTYLPDSLKQLFAKNCAVCQLHPAFSTTLYTTDGPAKNLADFHNCVVEFVNGNLDESYTHALNFIAHADTVNNKKVWLYAWFIKAKILYYKKLYAAAQAEYTRLLTIIPPGEYLLKSNIYTNSGEICLTQGQFKKALDYFTLWQKNFTASSDGYSAETVCQDMGVCFFNTGRVKEAKESFVTGVTLATQLNDTRSLATACANLANFYYGQFQDSLAIPFFEKSLLYAQKAGDIEILKDANLNMAVVEENRNNFKTALGYRKQYEQLQDSIWNRDNIWKLTSQERKFDAQLNKNKIQLLEQQAALRNSELKTRNLQRNSLFAATLALLIIAALVFWAYRLTAKKNMLITKQKEELDVLNKTKDRLYSIVAHDLRSPIRSLKTNLVGAKQALVQNNTTEAGVFIDNAQTTATNTFSLIDNLLNWALSQTNQLFFNPEKLQLATVVKHVCFDYSPFAATKNITLQQNIESSLYVLADINSLKIILRNLLDNAIKYTLPNGLIQVNAVIINNQCCLQVKDSGIGMDEVTLSAVFTNNGQKIMQDSTGYTSTGFGLGLCMVMAQKNNGSLQITSTKGIGTQANVYLPLTN